jgi:hypothetical protein
LPTLADLQRTRRAVPKGAIPTIREVKAERDRVRVVDAKSFRREVIARDGRICRCCHRKLTETRQAGATRLEVHHIHGRIGFLRFESRAACVLCYDCHGRVTGKVNDRLRIVATKMFSHRGRDYTDARGPLRFVQVTKEGI